MSAPPPPPNGPNQTWEVHGQCDKWLRASPPQTPFWQETKWGYTRTGRVGNNARGCP
jgi:hypothetical protein